MDSGAASGAAAVGERSAPRHGSMDWLRLQMVDAGAGDVFDELCASSTSRMMSRAATYALSDVAAAGPGDDGQYCAICLCQGDAAAGWKETPCGHRFHGVCVKKWLQAPRATATCPLCRREIPRSPPVAEEAAPID